MRCPVCKAEMICRQGEHHYKESGLDNVYLVGVDIFECSCGERVVNIPAVTELHNKLATDIIKKKSILNGKEIRFLRKNMGLTAVKLAGYLGVDNATISRWEKGKQPIRGANDRLLRLIFSNIKGIPAEEIKHLIEKDFEEITPERKEPAPYMIPRDEWSKIKICFTDDSG